MNVIKLKYHPDRLNQVKWGCILMAIRVFGLAFCWVAENYGNIPYVGDSVTIMISGGTLLLGILAFVGKVEMRVDGEVRSKRLSIAGIQVFEFSFRLEQIADVTRKDGTDLHFTLVDGRVCAFDNLKPKDARELYDIFRFEDDSEAG